MAVVHPNMAIDVQHRRLVGILTHPLGAQFGAPGVRLLLIGKQGDFLAHGAHFRNAVQPQQLAPFARCAVAQLLQRRQPCQGQKGQHQKQALQSIVALGQLEVFVRLMQQTDRQQRRQGEQHAPVGNIRNRLKYRFYGRQLSHAGRHPIQDVARPHPHRRLCVFGAALALGAQRCVEVFFFRGLCRRPAPIALASVSRFTASCSATSEVSKPSSNRSCACFNTSAVSTAGPRRFGSS